MCMHTYTHTCMCALTQFTAGLCDQTLLLQCLLKLMVFGIFHSSSNRICFRTIKRRKDSHLYFILVGITIIQCIQYLKKISVQNQGCILPWLNFKCLYKFQLILCSFSHIINTPSITLIHGLPVNSSNDSLHC